MYYLLIYEVKQIFCLFEYLQNNGTLIHVMTGACLHSTKHGESVSTKQCSTADNQKWTFEHYLT